MHNEGSEEESRVHYASALHPKHSQQPIVRRRHSGSVTKSNSSHSISSSRHGRSRTDSNGRRSNGGTHHPLTLTRNGSLDSAGVTRPHLSRTINRTDNSFRDDTESGDDEISSRKEEEAEVIIHQVTPTDSLAGVSLKYGISLADLRRANHLWANDSIYLRKVLYIPVDLSLKVRNLARDIKTNVAPLIDVSEPLSSQCYVDVADNEALNFPEGSQGLGLGIQRVPMSRMSFFPPPATSGKTPSISSTPSQLFPSNLKPPSHARYSTSPSLVSILTALPIAASTRDDLIARLSFDSTSSSVSDRSRSSLDPSEGHELNVVANRQPLPSKPDVGRQIRTISGLPSSSATSSSRLHAKIPLYHEPTTPVAAQSKQFRNPHSRHLSSSPPASYIPQTPDRSSIRTIQMEPSPIMQLPILRPRKSQLPSMNGTSASITHRSQDDVFELQ